MREGECISISHHKSTEERQGICTLWIGKAKQFNSTKTSERRQNARGRQFMRQSTGREATREQEEEAGRRGHSARKTTTLCLELRQPENWTKTKHKGRLAVVGNGGGSEVGAGGRRLGNREKTYRSVKKLRRARNRYAANLNT